MANRGARTPLRRFRIATDIIMATFFLMLLFIWATRYLLAGDPLVGEIEQQFGSDKVMHLSLGFFLPLCVGLLLRIYCRRLSIQAGYFMLVALVYALDEWFQTKLSYRSASIDDFLMSITGLALAITVWYCLLHLTKYALKK